MNEPTPERTAFVRFRKELVARNLDARLFDAVLAQLEAKGVVVKTGTPRIVQRGIWSKDPDALERWNAPIRRVRCRIEKIFGTWKRSYGLRSVRYRGLARVTCQVRLTAIAFNLKRAYRLLTPQAA